MINGEKKLVKRVIPDSRGRLSLKEFIGKADGFKAEKLPDGSIKLTPFAEVPISEPWLEKYPKLKAGFERGLIQAERGELYDLDEIDNDINV